MLPLVVQANAFHLDNIYGITFLYVIFGLPMNTFLYTGAIKAIPEALDEAAMIDGANPIQIFSRVIFPGIKTNYSNSSNPFLYVDMERLQYATGTLK